jgi:hypothetical protein
MNNALIAPRRILGLIMKEREAKKDVPMMETTAIRQFWTLINLK